MNPFRISKTLPDVPHISPVLLVVQENRCVRQVSSTMRKLDHAPGLQSIVSPVPKMSTLLTCQSTMSVCNSFDALLEMLRNILALTDFSSIRKSDNEVKCGCPTVDVPAKPLFVRDWEDCRKWVNSSFWNSINFKQTFDYFLQVSSMCQWNKSPKRMSTRTTL